MNMDRISINNAQETLARGKRNVAMKSAPV